MKPSVQSRVSITERRLSFIPHSTASVSVSLPTILGRISSSTSRGVSELLGTSVFISVVLDPFGGGGGVRIGSPVSVGSRISIHHVGIRDPGLVPRVSREIARDPRIVIYRVVRRKLDTIL